MLRDGTSATGACPSGRSSEMKTRTATAWVLLLALALQPLSASAEEAIALIASARSSKPAEISMPTLRRLYLGQTSRVARTRAEPLHLRSGGVTRQAFCLAVFGKSERAMEDYWIEQALTGGNIPPREFDSPATVIRAIAEREGRLGYVPVGALDSEALAKVPVLRVLHKGHARSPEDPAYPIRLR